MFTTAQRIFIRAVIVSLLSLIIAACGGGGNLEDIGKNESDRDDQGNYSGKIVIDMVAEPTISYDSDNGFTSIAVQFIPRTSKNQPLTPEQIDVRIKINDVEDVESRLNSSAQDLAYNVHYSLVLDTSYSMELSQAFTPMVQASQKSVQTGIEIWNDRAGGFTFQPSWFDSHIYTGINDESRQWSAQDMTSIPKPVEGAVTKLYGAIDSMLDIIISAEQVRADSDTNFQNVMLVFTDGIDNYSHFDNSDSSDNSEPTATSNGAKYLVAGRSPVALTTVLNKINAIENLTVHVIGLGKDIDSSALSAIASANNGIFLQNPETSDIVSLFDRVTQEFTTLQSHGVRTPLPAGEHTFMLQVTNNAGGKVTDYRFKFKTGDESAGMVSP